MDFMTAVKTCFSKYVDWNGRALRSEYWWWVLFVVIVSIVLAIVDMALGIQALGPLFSLATLLPGLFVGVRRLHDGGRSGWWMLIVIVPLIGVLVLLYWLIIEGEKSDNKYGPAH
jgi:uncharacterized membrane protein YhaH (DUF805 family)